MVGRVPVRQIVEADVVLGRDLEGDVGDVRRPEEVVRLGGIVLGHGAEHLARQQRVLI